ncbi:MAG: hypothetical protein VX006_00495 [Pseudomonadota bacterium]|nr:hypothetical protein [Pseudomonadota bacterium]
MKQNILSAFIILHLLFGCASFPSDIDPYPHSAAQYETASCAEIKTDHNRLVKRIEKISGDMKNTAQNDIWQIGASIIFWPFLLFLGDEDDFKKRELADLTGRINALEEAANLKECDLFSASN